MKLSLKTYILFVGEILYEKRETYVFAWNKLYDRELFSDLRYKEGMTERAKNALSDFPSLYKNL